MKLYALLILLGLVQFANCEKKIVCYWKFSSVLDTSSVSTKFDVTNIEPKLCTHLHLSSVGLVESGDIVSQNTTGSIPFEESQIFEKIQQLKKRNSKLKILVVVGDTDDDSAMYSLIVNDEQKRKHFIDGALEFLQNNKLDGLEIYWKYPNQFGGDDEEFDNYVIFLREIKAAFAGQKYLLSIAAAASEMFAELSYDIPAVSSIVDYINLMTLDMHTAKYGYLGFHTDMREVEKAVDYWLKSGATAEKLVLAIAAYGRTYKLRDETLTAPMSPSSGYGKPSPYTNETGFLGYNEICANKWHTEYYAKSQCPYAYNTHEWLAYDDKQSIKHKTDYLKANNLGGALLYSLETDDYSGECGEIFPLLNTINAELMDDLKTTTQIQNGESSSFSYDVATTTITLSHDVLITTRQLQQTTTTSSTSSETTIQIEAPNEVSTETVNERNMPQEDANANNDCNTDGFYPDPNSCSSFYRCAGSRKYKYECPAGLQFNRKSYLCDWPQNTDCKLSKNYENNKEDECQQDGIYLNPTDCERFYQCGNGQRHDYQCPTGLHFDTAIKVCNWPHLANCSL